MHSLLYGGAIIAIAKITKNIDMRRSYSIFARKELHFYHRCRIDFLHILIISTRKGVFLHFVFTIQYLYII